MAAAVIVAVVSTAAEAYAKQLAASVGSGIVETLFNQQQIASDLDEIKKQIAALSAFIRDKLPALIERAVDLAFIHKAEDDIAEKAKTIAGSIATLERAQKDAVPDVNIQFLVSELAGHADAIFEMGGTLITHGQPYYASVGIAFGAGLKAYAALVKVAPERVESLKKRALDWKLRLQPWVDATRPTSLVGYFNWLQGRYDLGLKTVPSFETWVTHTTREVAISWTRYAFTPPQIFVSGAWFGYWQDKGLQGDTLGHWLPPNVSFDEASANGMLQYTLPEWWTVKGDVPGSMADYEQCAAMLSTLIVDYYSYAGLAPTLKSAIALVTNALEEIEKILEATKDVSTDLIPPDPDAAGQTSGLTPYRVEYAMRLNRPGIGLTAARIAGTSL